MGQILSTEIDPFNLYDRTAVALKEDGLIVGHVPMEHSKICYFFLKHGGSIQVEVMGTRRIIVIDVIRDFHGLFFYITYANLIFLSSQPHQSSSSTQFTKSECAERWSLNIQ